VFAIGRNHPAVIDALKQVLDARLPNLVQMDVSLLAGILAERLLAFTPGMDRAFFCSTGSEAVESAVKFAHAATGRGKIVYCSNGFHGLTMGALSLNGSEVFRKGFEPLLPDCVQVPFNDLPALEAALRSNDVAGFFVEPIQGKGVYMPADGLSAAGAGSMPENTVRSSSPTRSRPAWDAPASSWPANIGASIPTWCCCRSRSPAASFRSARSLPSSGSSPSCSIAWTAPWCTARPSARMTWAWQRRSRPWA
jgi:hypothetical protein